MKPPMIDSTARMTATNPATAGETRASVTITGISIRIRKNVVSRLNSSGYSISRRAAYAPSCSFM